MSTTEIVATVGVISTPTVAIAGYVFNDRRARADRATMRELARDARLFDDLRSAYEGLVEFLLVMSAVVERTHPDMGPLPEPPDRPPEKELNSMLARASIIGSEEVMDAVDVLAHHWGAFLSWSQAVDALQAQRAYDQVPESQQKMLDARQAFRKQLAEVQRLIRREVRQ